MTNYEIFKAALRILAENENMADISDYEERFPYLLAVFCGEAEELDKKFREANKLPPSQTPLPIMLEMTEDFPLSQVFVSSAVYYVASMLIADENAEFSDKLFERYSMRMTDIYSALPSESQKIKNVYI